MNKIILIVIVLLGVGVFSNVIQTVETNGYSKRDIESKLKDIISEFENQLSEVVRYTDPRYFQFFHIVLNLAEKFRALPNFTVQYLLFTPDAPFQEFDLRPTQQSLANSTFNLSLPTKFVTHGYGVDLPKSSVFFDIQSKLLEEGEYNVIVVNWTKLNKLPYLETCANVVFVGFEIAKLIRFLMSTTGITPQSVHLIGHSLGAHVFSFTGKLVSNIGRITGLDAAGPLFQGLPSTLRITSSDAKFVDAIHTNGALSLEEGFGILRPYGHIDFFPNGGRKQPACSSNDTYFSTTKRSQAANTTSGKISCNHDRAPFLFLESIDDNECQFLSVRCNSYAEYKGGKCPPQSSVIAEIGFHAKPIPSLPKKSKFFLKTHRHSPYCIKSFPR